ncbi:MAG: PEP-CTERM sorting domain-containing protein [Chthonomonas sp.]|nr:PEP-CTERM sorting domain-containing protein [Chthonomonas sp.]
MISITSAPLSTGASWTTSGNAISFSTPNAIVGDPAATRSGILNIIYDVDAGAGSAINQVLANLGAVTMGSGQINFIEQVFELDSMGNEVGGAIGTATHNFTPMSSGNWSGATNVFAPKRYLRIKKSFVMTASPDTPALDLAALAINNQSVAMVVPEPASILAIGLAGVAFLARRKK